MIHAYDKLYLAQARTSLGRMLDYAVYDMNYSLAEFWELFLQSDISRKFERGDFAVLAGMSGIEIAREVAKNHSVAPRFTENRSAEYWTGWALAYYQWFTSLSFAEITSVISIEEVVGMYSPYHEMDIRQFCDHMNEMYSDRVTMSNLKRLRLAANYSQSELAAATDIPIRTIQQYEQKQKNINNARAEYVISLSRALCCEASELLEKIDLGGSV